MGSVTKSTENAPKLVDQYFDKYAESHQNKTNKLIHWICVPAIVFSLIGLLWSIPVPWSFMFLNWASFVIAFALYYYWQLSPRLAMVMVIIMALFSSLYVLIEQRVGLSGLAIVCAIIFVVSWVFQFIGHKIEGKKPSFLNDIKFLLIGPIWLLHFIFKKLGISY
ncbi:Mpo1 family 2-hydroxy fatty acid dioxygenase [Solitalea canadensis]|uniref:Putative membrane protein n=1 Tax=Solitalea canadensis (strain ATCC 29591 / DSM 3403 / JCM 21819 / LMG 8368 / NBRC 15130 / NCIMB 12057 / USAM 9D) TaxID=929556 RepID=H8KP17_SOLCM|nr:Mpo1-like protein [Solitalea canadensis]AFD05539.1 putative membrane protein [Solitalea canadensis DSM 3403]